ncbi:MAG: PD-(D/E)XK nuclease family protein, partial [Actinobacteria bacterium]|nr:PD-(D/E)XK nuclease family protein [Actinomycetota bacterium]
MSQSQTRFDTPLAGTWGLWPEPRSYWSYSSLNDIETCPLRWMLSRADYPDLWSGRGYPPSPAVAALFGDIVHTALETIVVSLQAAGCTSPQSADAAEVLRTLGGLTHVIDQVVTDHMTRLAVNPRLSSDRTAAVRRALAERVPEARTRVQSILSRTNLPARRSAGSASTPDAPSISGDHPATLDRGAFPEVALTASDLRLAGRIDLITVGEDHVRITDYKTGNEDPAHLDQLRTYALLWARDSTANPARRLATELLVEYPTHNIRVSGPDADELRALETKIAERIVIADDLVGHPPPPAKPDPEVCRFCAVRQM